MLTDTPGDQHMKKSGAKTERLEARSSVEEKEAIQHAANLEGCSLSEFIVSRSYEAAQVVISTHESIVLSPRASRAFVEALLNPPAPNDHLRAAFAVYRQGVAKDSIRDA